MKSNIIVIIIMCIAFNLVGQDNLIPLDSINTTEGLTHYGLITKEHKKYLKIRTSESEWEDFKVDLGKVASFHRTDKKEYNIGDDKGISLYKVFNIEGSADELYDKALLWFTETYVSSEAVIELENKDSHTIVGTGRHYEKTKGYGYKSQLGLKLTTKIQTKDGRIRITVNEVTSIVIPNSLSASAVGNNYEDIIELNDHKSAVYSAIGYIEVHMNNIKDFLKEDKDSGW